MDSQRPAAAETKSARSLGSGQLTLVDAVAQSVGFMGPVFTVALLITLVVGAGAAGKGAGVATPIALLIAWVGMTAIGWIIARYAARIHTAGSLYDYVTAGLGERVGTVCGYLYYGAMVALGAGASIAVGGIAADFLSSTYGVSIPYWVLDIGIIALVCGLLCRGVALSTRIQLVLVGASVLVVVIFFLYVVVKSGTSGNSLAPFRPSSSQDGWSGIVFGVIYGVLCFAGFESAANLAEETRNPRKAIPRAIFLALFVVGAFYIFAAYAQAVGFKLDAQAWAGQGAPLAALGAPGAFGNSFLFAVLQGVVILDLLAVLLGLSVAVSRGVFAMSRDRRLPDALARTNKRGTPVAAVIGLVVVYLIAVIATRLGHGILALGGAPEYIPIFAWLSGLGGLGLAVVYGAVALGALRGLNGHENPWLYVPASIVGLLVAGGAVWGSMYKVPSPSSYWIYILAGAVAIFAVAVTVQVARGTFGATDSLSSEAAADELV